MAQAKKADRGQLDTSNVPQGHKRVDLRPQKITDDMLVEGFELSGSLGATNPGKGDLPPYRSIRTDDGELYWLPSHAALRGLMDFAIGQHVVVRYEGGNGKKGDPYEWAVFLPEGDDLPF